jgi:dsDNA-specific endonuclease/ATPase MutS2
LIKVDDELFNSYLISKMNYKEIQFQNIDEKKKNKFKINKQRKDITVVDLHIDKLIKFQRNLKKYEILSFQLKIAKKKLDLAILNGAKRIIFIHGVGQGILKFELEKILRLYNNLEFYPANFKEYGYGATEVSILTKKS